MARSALKTKKVEDRKPSSGRDGTVWSIDMNYNANNDGSDNVFGTLITDGGTAYPVLIDNIKFHDGKFFKIVNGTETLYESANRGSKRTTTRKPRNESSGVNQELKCHCCKKERKHGEHVTVNNQQVWVCQKCISDGKINK